MSSNGTIVWRPLLFSNCYEEVPTKTETIMLPKDLREQLLGETISPQLLQQLRSVYLAPKLQRGHSKMIIHYEISLLTISPPKMFHTENRRGNRGANYKQKLLC